MVSWWPKVLLTAPPLQLTDALREVDTWMAASTVQSPLDSRDWAPMSESAVWP